MEYFITHFSGESPTCRCAVGKLSDSEKTLFETLTEISSKVDFELQSEEDLIGRNNHDELLKVFEQHLKTDPTRFRYLVYMAGYRKLAKKIRKGVDVVRSRMDSTVGSPLSLEEDQLREDAQKYPPLPTDGKSNDEWMVLPEFAQLAGKPVKDIRTFFAGSKKPVAVQAKQCRYIKCTAGYMKDSIWGQVPKEMKSNSEKSGYFILRKSIPSQFLCPKQKKK